MTDSNVDYKKKNIFLFIGIMMLGLLAGGATYAYLVSGTSINNGNYLYNTSCFNIFYDITNDGGDTSNLSGTLVPSHNALGGLYGKITLGLSSECNLKAVGNIYLQVQDMGLYGSDTLIQTIDGHCEEPDTLVFFDEENEFWCESAGMSWITGGTALKYAIYDGDVISKKPVKVGYIDRYDEYINMYSFNIDATALDDTDEDTISNYYVYIWLDGNLSNNTYSGIPFRGRIFADVVQQET